MVVGSLIFEADSTCKQLSTVYSLLLYKQSLAEQQACSHSRSLSGLFFYPHWHLSQEIIFTELTGMSAHHRQHCGWRLIQMSHKVTTCHISDKYMFVLFLLLVSDTEMLWPTSTWWQLWYLLLWTHSNQCVLVWASMAPEFTVHSDQHNQALIRFTLLYLMFRMLQAWMQTQKQQFSRFDININMQ